jgi:hypothetical protein
MLTAAPGLVASGSCERRQVGLYSGNIQVRGGPINVDLSGDIELLACLLLAAELHCPRSPPLSLELAPPLHLPSPPSVVAAIAVIRWKEQRCDTMACRHLSLPPPSLSPKPTSSPLFFLSLSLLWLLSPSRLCPPSLSARSSLSISHSARILLPLSSRWLEHAGL